MKFYVSFELRLCMKISLSSSLCKISFRNLHICHQYLYFDKPEPLKSVRNSTSENKLKNCKNKLSFCCHVSTWLKSSVTIAYFSLEIIVKKNSAKGIKLCLLQF